MDDPKQNPQSKAKAPKRSGAGTRRHPGQRPPRPGRGDQHRPWWLQVFLHDFCGFFCVWPLKRGFIWTPSDRHSTIPPFLNSPLVPE